jgi:hypothetical protein
VNSSHFLFGPAVAPEVLPILEAGLEELPGDLLTRLGDDLFRAQTVLIGAAFRAAVNSGRVSAICPDTPGELLDPNPARIALRISKESA